MSSYLCPSLPDHIRRNMAQINPRGPNVAKRRTLEATVARKRERLSWLEYHQQIDKLMTYTQESADIMARRLGIQPKAAARLGIQPKAAARPNLASIRARFAALERKLTAPRRAWDRDTLRAFIDRMESSVAAGRRGQATPIQRVYTLPVSEGAGAISGAAAGFRWDARQGGWVGFRPGAV